MLMDGSPIGIGIDAVSISEMARLDDMADGFSSRTFSQIELEQAATRRDRASFLAGNFAVKEAVFKAVAHLLPEGTFDLRAVSTIRRPDGSPHVPMEGAFAEICEGAGVSSVLVSITNEGDLAIAVAVALSGDHAA